MRIPKIRATQRPEHVEGSDEWTVDLILDGDVPGGNIIRVTIPRAIIQGILDMYPD